MRRGVGDRVRTNPTSSDLEKPMRYARTAFSVAALLIAATTLSCAGGEKTETPDSAAAAVAAAPPPPESFTLAAEDGSWTGDITSTGIVFRHKKNDSLMFPATAYTGSSSLREYSSVMAGADTVRITMTMALTKCTDKAGKEYTHLVQVWLTGDVKLESKGCAIQK